jgi:hypothetical protein
MLRCPIASVISKPAIARIVLIFIIKFASSKSDQIECAAMLAVMADSLAALPTTIDL